MTREEELLFEQALAAHRVRRPDGTVKSSPAWHDLSEALRVDAFEKTVVLREVEAAIDPLGQSTTVKSLLARILGP